MATLITLSQAEAVLVDDFGPALIACDLATTPATDSTPRSYLAMPIAFAAREQGVIVAVPTAPTDTDLQGVSQLDRFLDIAKLKLLEKLVRSFVQVTWSTNTTKQDLSQYRTDLIAQLAEKRDECRKLYGFGLGSVSAGTVRLGMETRGWWECDSSVEGGDF